MKEPKRLLDGAGSDFEVELLRSGKRDGISAERRHRMLGTLGVGAAGLSGGATLGNSSGATGGGVGPAPHPPAPMPPATLPLSEAGAVAKPLLGKLLVAGAAVGAVGIVTAAQWGPSWVGSDDRAATEPSSIVSIKHVPVEHVIDSVDTRLPETELEAAAAQVDGDDSPPRRKVRHSPQRASTKTAHDSLSQELRMIEAARRTLAGAKAGAAIRQLDDYVRQYPQGRLRAEASVLRIEALMAKGDRAAAARLGKAYLKRSPNGPYARRIRSVLERGGVGAGP